MSLRGTPSSDAVVPVKRVGRAAFLATGFFAIASLAARAP
jgi:hypothetical protein